MQIGLIGFGFILGGGILMKLTQEGVVWFMEIPILIYRISMCLSGMFCTKPFFESDDYSHFEDQAHSLFANLAGISFSLGIIVRAVFAEFLVDFVLHMAFLLLVLVCSIASSKTSSRSGIIQIVERTIRAGQEFQLILNILFAKWPVKMSGAMNGSKASLKSLILRFLRAVLLISCEGMGCRLHQNETA